MTKRRSYKVPTLPLEVLLLYILLLLQRYCKSTMIEATCQLSNFAYLLLTSLLKIIWNNFAKIQKKKKLFGHGYHA